MKIIIKLMNGNIGIFEIGNWKIGISEIKN